MSRYVERMVETIRELYKKYPDGKIPFDESPTLSSQVFLDLCERVIALEQAYTVLLTERAERINNDN